MASYCGQSFCERAEPHRHVSDEDGAIHYIAMTPPRTAAEIREAIDRKIEWFNGRNAESRECMALVDAYADAVFRERFNAMIQPPQPGGTFSAAPSGANQEEG